MRLQNEFMDYLKEKNYSNYTIKSYEKDLDFLAKSAFEDACLPGNPRDTNQEEIKNLYKELL